MTTETWLCIGGPLAGKRYNALDKKEFSVPILDRMPDTPILSDSAMTPATRSATYVKRVWTAGNETFTVWVDASIPEYEILRVLLSKPAAFKGALDGYADE